MRAFYRAWPESQILQTVSGEFASASDFNTIPGNSSTISTYLASRCRGPPMSGCFPPRTPGARNFHQTEALRSGWSVRELDRRIGSQFYERIALSKNNAVMLEMAETAEPSDTITPEEAIKDPFLNLAWFRTIWDGFDRTMVVYWSCGLSRLALFPHAESYEAYVKNNRNLLHANWKRNP
jgi:hypothetical protein